MLKVIFVVGMFFSLSSAYAEVGPLKPDCTKIKAQLAAADNKNTSDLAAADQSSKKDKQKLDPKKGEGAD